MKRTCPQFGCQVLSLSSWQSSGSTSSSSWSSSISHTAGGSDGRQGSHQAQGDSNTKYETHDNGRNITRAVHSRKWINPIMPKKATWLHCPNGSERRNLSSHRVAIDG
ncbi:hypothetical protein B0H12DRAFT_738057 [Mycena haematopus]|nr:hypothetical protein B0H12DRAFT_738057 [Mycena haematopus]